MPSDEMLVHIIDDDQAMRESLVFLLRSAHIAAETFASGPAFLASLPDDRLRCVITDVRMPEMSGLELLRRLREMTIVVPVIVITGHGDVPLAVEAMKFGAIDFLEKPFDDEVLLASVRAAWNGSRARSSATPSAPTSKTGSRRFRTVNATCFSASSRGGPTNRSRTIWGSARGRWKSTAPI